jgi:hypothetical protein
MCGYGLYEFSEYCLNLEGVAIKGGQHVVFIKAEKSGSFEMLLYNLEGIASKGILSADYRKTEKP